jgi:hypothetical protein
MWNEVVTCERVTASDPAQPHLGKGLPKIVIVLPVRFGGHPVQQMLGAPYLSGQACKGLVAGIKRHNPSH